MIAFGTIGFWVLLILVSILLLVFIEYEEGGAATLTLLCFLWIQQLFGVNIVHYTCTHTLRIVVGILGYLLAGVVWGVVKWWFFVKDRRYKYDEEYSKFLENKGVGWTWDEYVKAHGLGKPTASEHKERILEWMSFWPWSLLWTLINDPIRKAFRAIYRHIQNRLQAIADSAYAGTENLK